MATCHEPKALYHLSENLTELSAVAFSQKSPQLLGYTNRSAFFQLYDVSVNFALKANKRLESCATCFNLYDGTSVTLGFETGALGVFEFEKDAYAFACPGHEGKVCSVDSNPYSKLFVTSSIDTTLKIWDTRIKTAFRTLKLNNGAYANTVRLSPDGTWVAASCANGCAILYDIISNKVIYEFPDTNNSYFIDFHPDELLLCTCSKSGNIQFWELSDFSQSTSLALGENVTCVKFHSNGLCLFYGTISGKIVAFNSDTNASSLCTVVEGSPVKDIFQYDDKICFLASLEERLAVLECPYESIELSHDDLVTYSNSGTIDSNRTYTKLPLLDSELSNALSFNSIKDDRLLQSTPIDTETLRLDPSAEPSICSVSLSLESFSIGHSKLCQLTNKRVGAYEKMHGMLRIRNITDVLKAADEGNDPYILSDAIGAVSYNAAAIRGFPYSLVMRRLKSLTFQPAMGPVVSQHLFKLLRSLQSNRIDETLRRELVQLSEKVKKPDKNEEMLRLIIARFVDT